MSNGGIAWRRLSLGLNCIGFGSFLLLTTQGLLPWSFWLHAAALWPVLLVALGLRLVFERSRLPWAVLASPLLIQGTLSYVALRPPPEFVGEWRELRVDRSEGTERWTLDGELALASLDVRGADLPPGVLAQGRAASRDGRAEIAVSPRSGGPRVRLRDRAFGARLWPRDQQRWELNVAGEVPLRVDLEAAFVKGRLHFPATPVERLDLDGAFNDVVVTLGAPQRDVRIDVDGAFNTFRLLVPPDTPVRVRADGALLGVKGRNTLPERHGPGYDVRLSGFASQLEVGNAAATSNTDPY